MREYGQIAIKALQPYERNARTHSEQQIEKIANSIKEFGFLNPVLIDGNNMIIAGHGRVLAAKKLKMKDVPYLRVEDLTPTQVRAYILADNKLAEDAGWDELLVSQELAALQDEDFDIELTGFTLDDIQFEDDVENQTEEEDVVDVPEEAITKLGDIWQMGGHRLICGDSTDTSVLERLMDGKKADMVFTDPPYNIASDSKNFAADCSKSMEKLSKAEWDMDFDIDTALNSLFTCLAENVTVYICTSHFLANRIWEWMKTWADHDAYCIWSKPNPMPSLSKRHWTWNTELICYATRGKHTFNFPKEGHALSTWTINKKNGKTGHPTEKPVEVPEMAITHSSKKQDIILDCFGGSGSTLIACEQTGRKGYLCELDPHYCDVIVQRWERLTGRRAVLANG